MDREKIMVKGKIKEVDCHYDHEKNAFVCIDIKTKRKYYESDIERYIEKE